MKGDPDVVYCNGYDRLQLSNSLLNGPNNTSYTVFIDNNQMNNVTVGALVSSFTNEVTGKSVLSRFIPGLLRAICLSGKPRCHYHMRTYPNSRNGCRSGLCPASTAHNAPQWNALISGIAGSGVPEVPALPGDS